MMYSVSTLAATATYDALEYGVLRSNVDTVYFLSDGVPSLGKYEEREAILLDWIKGHRSGVGWHGGPISLRAFHWVKLLTTPSRPRPIFPTDTLLKWTKLPGAPSRTKAPPAP